MADAALSRRHFEQMFPRAAECFDHFVAPCAEFGISTTERQAAFFAQLHHESNGLIRLSESFAYTPARLMAVWPFRFRALASAREWAAKTPEEIASYVYSNRMGNGSPKTGDGWRYRGQGFVQLTGRNNYAEFGAALGIPLLERPELAAVPAHAARIAARFWATRGCNPKADAGDIRAITLAINGGLNGLKERTETWRRFQTILANAPNQEN